MLRFTRGNLLEAEADALVNTVNTVGVMGKGIALMFKEAFPDNYRAYAAACKRGEVRVGEMFVTDRGLQVPRWIINFPTKKHWRNRTQLAWVREGLEDLRRVIEERQIQSIAVPPLGCGNGGLSWKTVRPMIEEALRDLPDTDVIVFEPTRRYLNVVERSGVAELTPARALIAELVRRYWILGIPCTLLEIQKLAWFLDRELAETEQSQLLNLQFQPHYYGPYSDRLRHLLEGLDGSYLRSEKRIADSKPDDVIAFDDSKREQVDLYLRTEAREYLPALEAVTQTIDGFESPLGMELLATVDWLLTQRSHRPEVADLKVGLEEWPGGKWAARRKLRIFDDRMLELALARLAPVGQGSLAHRGILDSP